LSCIYQNRLSKYNVFGIQRDNIYFTLIKHDQKDENAYILKIEEKFNESDIKYHFITLSLKL